MGFIRKIRNSGFYQLVFPNVASSRKVIAERARPIRLRWCYKFLDHKKISSLFICFFLLVTSYWTKRKHFYIGVSPSGKALDFDSSTRPNKLSGGSNPPTPATLPISLMVERPALTRNAEVRYLDGQPAVDVADYINSAVWTKSNVFMYGSWWFLRNRELF